MPIRSASRFRNASLATLASLLAACASGHVQTAPTPTKPPDAENAVARAQTRLDTAGRVGDLAAIAALFLPDGRLLAPAPVGTATGPRAVAAHLGVRPDTAADATVLSFSRGDVQACRDGGAVETGVYLIQERRPGSAYDEVASGPYRLRWRVDDRGNAMIETLALATAAAPGQVAAVHCATLARATYEQRRLFLAVSIPQVGIGAWDTPSGMRSTLASRGWTTDVIPYTPSQVDTTRRGGELHSTPLTVSARVRAWRMLSVEAYAQLSQEKSLQRAYNPNADSHVVQTFAASEASAVLSGEWHRLRAGIGPAFVRVNWQNYQDRWVPVPGGDPAYQYQGQAVTQRLSSTASGVALQAAYSFPLTSRVFAEMFARARRGTRMTVPALGPYPAWQANFDGSTLGLNLGVALW